jgi:hypothetical protein
MDPIFAPVLALALACWTVLLLVRMTQRHYIRARQLDFEKEKLENETEKAKATSRTIHGPGPEEILERVAAEGKLAKVMERQVEAQEKLQALPKLALVEPTPRPGFQLRPAVLIPPPIFGQTGDSPPGDRPVPSDCPWCGRAGLPPEDLPMRPS